jgi:high-affinity nickel-transport protein
MAWPRRRTLTLFGRCVCLVGGEIATNAIVWIAASLVFGVDAQKRNVLSLCLIAWTFGLRHGLGAWKRESERQCPHADNSE